MAGETIEPKLAIWVWISMDHRRILGAHPQGAAAAYEMAKRRHGVQGAAGYPCLVAIGGYPDGANPLIALSTALEHWPPTATEAGRPAAQGSAPVAPLPAPKAPPKLEAVEDGPKKAEGES